MSWFTSEVAAAFLLWSERQKEHRCVGRLPGGDSLLLSEVFTAELRRTFPARPEDDLKNASKAWLQGGTSLWEWYEKLRQEHAVEITFFGGEPRIGQECLRTWVRLARRFDPDAIIVHALVEQGQECEVLRLTGWHVLATSADVELERLFRRKGLVDTHVHLSGCDPIAGLWQRLVAGRTSLARLDRYRPSSLARLACWGRERRRAEMERVESGLAARRKLAAAFARDARFHSREATSRASREPLLQMERRLLAWAWWRCKHHDESTAVELDRYLLAKNLFFLDHHQQEAVGPGLRSFRSYFDQGNDALAKESRRIRGDRIERQVRFATECRLLQHLELRIAPFSRVDEYVEFFKTWNVLLERRGTRRPHIRFIVHFLRPTRQNDRNDGVPHAALRRKIDRQSAVLHLFRRSHPALAEPIVGIDVANLERDCPPEVFTPYLLLLRGDFRKLRSLPGDSPFYACWHRLVERAEAWHSVNLPRLMLTYHAGEDFYHPLQGMYDMASAVKGGCMLAGDRIGHGLAAGCDFGAFEEKGERAGLLIPKGVLWDALVWAHRRAEEVDLASSLGMRFLQERIYRSGEELYGEHVRMHVAYELLDCRHELLPKDKTIDLPPGARRLWERELFDLECRGKRRELIEFPIDRSARHVFESVQRGFIRELARRRIVIEFNPSSNLLVSGEADLRRHPFFRYHAIAGKALAASFNTDDPGVFATRIDLEHALMFDAMLQNGWQRHECIDILEQVLDSAALSIAT